jgi:hypothetical protein
VTGPDLDARRGAARKPSHSIHLDRPGATNSTVAVVCVALVGGSGQPVRRKPPQRGFTAIDALRRVSSATQSRTTNAAVPSHAEMRRRHPVLPGELREAEAGGPAKANRFRRDSRHLRHVRAPAQRAQGGLGIRDGGCAAPHAAGRRRRWDVTGRTRSSSRNRLRTSYRSGRRRPARSRCASRPLCRRPRYVPAT